MRRNRLLCSGLPICLYYRYLDRKAVFDFDFETAKLLIYMQCKAMGWGRALKGLPAPVTFLNNLISLMKQEMNEKRAVITLGHRETCTN